MAKAHLRNTILGLLHQLASAGHPDVTPREIVFQVGASAATVRRYLDRLVDEGLVERHGRTAATRYRLPASPGARAPVAFQRRFIDDYQPNQTFLLPESLAGTLYDGARLTGRQPAGTYASAVLGPLLTDLSCSSSRLDGGRHTLPATEALFRAVRPDVLDRDTIMLLNHKAAIEFLVDSVPRYGMTTLVVRNLHAVLMQGLLADEDGLGTIREKVICIGDSVYIPSHAPLLLGEMFEQILEKARRTRNPVEAAFFLWVSLAYLLPFEDGNERTSRLAANIPLMLCNCAPQAFLDVAPHDYAQAMVAIREQQDPSAAGELFTRSYRRSIRKYAALMAAIGQPDPFRAGYREQAGEVVRRVVRDRVALSQAVDEVAVPAQDRAAFERMARADLERLGEHNCALYRLTMRQAGGWIEAGRPLYEKG